MVWLLVLHAALSAVTIILVLLLPWRIAHPGGRPPATILLPAVSSGLAAALLILIVVVRFGVKRLRMVTMVPLVIMLLFIFGVRAVLRPARNLFNQEKHPLAGRCLFCPAAGCHHQPDCPSEGSCRRLQGTARRGIRPFLLP